MAWVRGFASLPGWPPVISVRVALSCLVAEDPAEVVGSESVSRPVSTRPGLAEALCVRAVTRSWIVAPSPSAVRHYWYCGCVVLANSRPLGTCPVVWEEDLVEGVGLFARLDAVLGCFGSGFEGRQWG